MDASLKSCDLVSRRLETRSLSRILVADVFRARFPADEKPVETSAHRFDDIPRIEGVHESFGANWSAMVSRLWIRKETCGGF